jgi:hypothetical protein
MKTLKIVAIFTLVAALSLVPMTSAWAHDSHHHHRHHDTGAIWGAAVGGTMLGLVVGSMASQPREATQPQVVVVQPQTSDASFTQQNYTQLELERERTRRIALEMEIERIRADADL